MAFKKYGIGKIIKKGKKLIEVLKTSQVDEEEEEKEEEKNEDEDEQISQ